MAAIGRRVTLSCKIRCFLAGKQGRTIQTTPQIQNNRLLQCSHLHTMKTSSRTLLGRRQQDRLVWINAVTLRQNSSQVPSVGEAVAATHSLQPADPQVLVPADSTSVLAQPLTEKLTVETFGLDFGVDTATAAAEVLQAAEPRLTELGLGCYTPVGLIQNILDALHLDLGLPWWGAIVAATVIARTSLFPFYVMGLREGTKVNNVQPELAKHRDKINETWMSGNQFEYAKASADFKNFQKKHDISPILAALLPLAQAPIFVCFFLSLKKMAYLPVPALQTGGALWFTDLTLADPLYLLPLVATGLTSLIIRVGAESAGVSNPNMEKLKTVMCFLPVLILPVTISFPTAVFVYWTTSNGFSLCQLALIQRPAVKRMLRIPDRVQHAPGEASMEGLIAGIKKGWKEAVLADQLKRREERIKNQFELAARGPLRQTFAQNPQRATPAAKDKPREKLQ